MTSAHDPPPPAPASRTSWLVWGSLVAVAAAFVTRLPAIVEPLGPDQGVYATIGWALERGLALYRNLFEQKPPAIYLTYRLGFAVFGATPAAIFWLDYLAAAITTIVLFDLGRRLVHARFGAIAAAVFAWGTLPAARHAYGGFLERSINEPFIILFVAVAAWATAIWIRRRSGAWPAVAGLAIGLASVYKPMALVYGLAIAVWVAAAGDFAAARRWVTRALPASVLPPALALGWMWWTGILEPAWIALAEYNSAYLAVGDVSLVGIIDQFAHEVWRRMKTDEIWAFGTLAAAAAVLAWRRHRTRAGAAASLGVLWLGATLVAVVLNGPRMFQTYFVPCLVPLCFLAAWMVDQVIGARGRWKSPAAAALVALAILMFVRSGSIGRAASMTTWDGRHWVGAMDRDTYLQRFQSRAPGAFSAADNERLAEYLRARTDPDERIFVFGMTASAYFQSGRLPASRFLFVYPAVSNMIDRPGFTVDSLAAELARTRPRYIVLQRGNRDSFSGWRADESFAAPAMTDLLREYVQEADIGGFGVYRRQ